MAEVQDCGLEVGNFELQLCSYIHFWINTIGKSMNPLIPTDMG